MLGKKEKKERKDNQKRRKEKRKGKKELLVSSIPEATQGSGGLRGGGRIWGERGRRKKKGKERKRKRKEKEKSLIESPSIAQILEDSS